MAVCCIGGVCIPYSALLPLLVVGLKWILEQATRMGLVPEAWQKRLQTLFDIKNDKSSVGKKEMQSRSPSNVTTATSSSSSSFSSSEHDTVVRKVESEEAWNGLIEELSKTKKLLVIKFTASWCQPCHKIQPLYQELASQYAATTQFVTVDVDEVDEVASEYNVAILPTFVAATVADPTRPLEKYTGSKEDKLREFLSKALDAATGCSAGKSAGCCSSTNNCSHSKQD